MSSLIEIIRENALIQFTCTSTKVYKEEFSISTNYSTRVFYLSQSQAVHFDESLSAASFVTPPTDILVCCPRIESLKVNKHYICKNCTKKLQVIAGIEM